MKEFTLKYIKVNLDNKQNIEEIYQFFNSNFLAYCSIDKITRKDGSITLGCTSSFKEGGSITGYETIDIYLNDGDYLIIKDYGFKEDNFYCVSSNLKEIPTKTNTSDLDFYPISLSYAPNTEDLI